MGNENSEIKTNSANPQNVYTTIRIYPGQDGRSYRLEIIEPEAKNGNRIDQKIALKILAVDNQFRDPQFLNMMQQSQQNPMGFMQGLFQRMFNAGGGGGMPPMMGGGGFPPMGFM